MWTLPLKWMVYFMDNPTQMDDYGLYPLFRTLPFYMISIFERFERPLLYRRISSNSKIREGDLACRQDVKEQGLVHVPFG